MIQGGFMEIPRNKIIFALISFIVGLFIIYIVGGYVQYRLGLPGLVITELIILGIALASVAASRMNFRQVFRVKVSTFIEWLSSFCIYLSAFFGSMAVSLALSNFFPSVTETGDALGSFMLSGSFLLALVAVSILPGICEEAWHRGYLLSSLGSIKSVAARVAIMGFVFGLFHLDPTRFFQTMILGMALSFMRIKTDNLLVPVVFHSANNLFSLSLTYLLASLSQDLVESTGEVTEIPPVILILYLCFFVALSIMFLSLGLYCFKKVKPRRKRTPASQARMWPLPDTRLAPPSTIQSQTELHHWAPPTGQPVFFSTLPPVSASMWQAPPWQQPVEPQKPKSIKTIIVVSICGGVALLSCFSCLILSTIL